MARQKSELQNLYPVKCRFAAISPETKLFNRVLNFVAKNSSPFGLEFLDKIGMSGHSKWAQIKHKKAITDAKKSKIFSKLAAVITIAAREKGGEIDKNPKLRLAIEKAKSYNMPQDNIKKAVKRGTGEIEGMKYEEIYYEAYGPAGIAIIIKVITDNKNRTLAEIKHILSEYGGKFAESGSVRYLFDEKGVIVIKLETCNLKPEELELAAIEAGAKDIKSIGKDNEKYLEIYTSAKELVNVRKKLEEKGIAIESASIDLIPKNEIKITDKTTKEKALKLFEAIDEQSETEEIFSNLNEN